MTSPRLLGFWPSRERLSQLAQKSGVRIFASLAWRHLAARMISALCLLVAASVYDLWVFADFGVYLAAMNIAGLILFMRYEGAIVGAANAQDASLAVKACVMIGGVMLIFVGCLVVLASGMGDIPWTLASLFVAGLAARGWLRLAVTYATRVGDFAVLARATAVQAVVQPALLLAFLATPMDGLIALALSDVAGHAVAALVAVWLQRRGLGQELAQPMDTGEIRGLLQRWSELPMFNLPGALMSTVFIATPLILTPMVADAHVAGALALAYRLLDLPTQLIGAAATPLVANRLQTDNGWSVGSVTKWLLIFSAIVLAAFGLVGIVVWLLAQFVTSPKWNEVLALVPPLVMFHAALAIAGPISEAGAQFRDQRVMTLTHGLAALMGGVVFTIMDETLVTSLLIIGGIAMARALAIIWRVSNVYGASLLSR